MGQPTYFVSHAWDSPFVELVASVAAFLEGAAQDETFVWLDIFAINQDDSSGVFSAMAELDDGRTLARVIELSRATLVVLDRERAAPFGRLWCLYEIGSTPTNKLQLLTHGFSEADISQHVRAVDAETALCFSADDREMIRAEIAGKFGSLQQFTVELRLRLLLRPMSTPPTCGRCATGPGRRGLLVRPGAAARRARPAGAGVVGGPGEGKSTLAAVMAMAGSGGGGGGFVHAAHFCKRADPTGRTLGQRPVDCTSCRARWPLRRSAAWSDCGRGRRGADRPRGCSAAARRPAAAEPGDGGPPRRAARGRAGRGRRPPQPQPGGRAAQGARAGPYQRPVGDRDHAAGARHQHPALAARVWRRECAAAGRAAVCDCGGGRAAAPSAEDGGLPPDWAAATRRASIKIYVVACRGFVEASAAAASPLPADIDGGSCGSSCSHRPTMSGGCWPW